MGLLFAGLAKLPLVLVCALASLFSSKPVKTSKEIHFQTLWLLLSV